MTFFDTFSILIITFFAALGMVNLSEWLLRKPLKKAAKQTKFSVIRVSTVKEEELEQTLRLILSDGLSENINFLLDMRGVSTSSKVICEELRKRYGFFMFDTEETALSFIKESLQRE